MWGAAHGLRMHRMARRSRVAREARFPKSRLGRRVRVQAPSGPSAASTLRAPDAHAGLLSLRRRVRLPGGACGVEERRSLLPAIAGGCRANLTWLIPGTRLVNDTSVVACNVPLRGSLDATLDSGPRNLVGSFRRQDAGLISRRREFDSPPHDTPAWLNGRASLSHGEDEGPTPSAGKTLW